VPGSSDDDRPPMVVAMHWVQQITSISIEMVAPAGVGYWLDGKWRTGPWLLVAGAVLGFLLAMWHLLALAKRVGSGSSGPTRGRTWK
jgi:F0F1-type ATP synthase assembly protein I